MRYSYTKHRRKSAFTEDMQLLLIFFTITLLMLLLTYVFLLFKDYKFDEAKKNFTQKKVDLNISIYNMKKEITFIEKQSILAETIHTKNAVLKDSISNLFDLVPQRITLSEATLLENGLIQMELHRTKMYIILCYKHHFVLYSIEHIVVFILLKMVGLDLYLQITSIKRKRR